MKGAYSCYKKLEFYETYLFKSTIEKNELIEEKKSV